MRDAPFKKMKHKSTISLLIECSKPRMEEFQLKKKGFEDHAQCWDEK